MSRLSCEHMLCAWPENAKINPAGLYPVGETDCHISKCDIQGYSSRTEVHAGCYLITHAQTEGVMEGFAEKVKTRLEAETSKYCSHTPDSGPSPEAKRAHCVSLCIDGDCNINLSRMHMITPLFFSEWLFQIGLELSNI